MSEDKKRNPIPGDNPIRDPKDDILQRASSAQAFARHVLALDTTEGAAVGLFGPWGSGKTSFVNLARKTFEAAEIPVLDFNPWLFSGTEQLIERFFAEVAASMDENSELKEIGEVFRKYGTALNATASIASTLLGLPQIGELVGKITKAAENTGVPESVVAQRRAIRTALEKRGRQIIVVLDDVDRLSASEIREVFKLIRLTASFPNIVYIVPCDRPRVEAALSEREPSLSGSDYLEKIIQWSSNLPEIPVHLLRKQLWTSVDRALADIDEPGRFDEQTWPDIRTEIIEPLIRNIRDVRRYTMAIRETVSGLKGQIALADVLALEAVRVFLPEVFRHIPVTIDGLTMESKSADIRFMSQMERDPEDPLTGFYSSLKAQVDRLISAAEDNGNLRTTRTTKEVVRTLIFQLFPVGYRRLQLEEGDSDLFYNVDAVEHVTERRVAQGDVLRLYLERVASPELLAFHDAERAFERMADHERLDDFIRSLDPTRWLDVVANFRHLASKFRPEHVEPGLVVVLNLLPGMSEQSLVDEFSDATTQEVRNAVQLLLRTLKTDIERESVVHNVLPKVEMLSSKVVLLAEIGHRQGVGSQLVAEVAADHLEKKLSEEIGKASEDELARDHNVWRVLHFAKAVAEPSAFVLPSPDSSKLTLSLLKSVRRRITSPTLAEHATERAPILHWDRLIQLFGGDSEVAERVNRLRTELESLKPWLESQKISIEEAEELLTLAEANLSGPQSDLG